MKPARCCLAAAMAALTGCGSGHESKRDAGIVPRDAGAPMDTRDGAAPTDLPAVVPCSAEAAQPCPPSSYATWPMPNPPGVPLPHSARYRVGLDTVQDQVTQLVWQRNFTPKQSWAEATRTCEMLNLGNASDWRLPSRIELISLVDYTRQPSIDHEAFPDTPEDYFWASSRLASNQQQAFSVYFGAGLTAYGEITGASGHARCVRGGSAGVLPRFAVNDAEARDQNTGLTWQRASIGKLAWESGAAYCAGLGREWRLPSTKELQTLVDESRVSPAIDPTAFPDTAPERFWTGSLSNKVALQNAVYVDMDEGASEEASTTEAHWIRCVR